jgi:hypothetical protein
MALSAEIASLRARWRDRSLGNYVPAIGGTTGTRRQMVTNRDLAGRLSTVEWLSKC